MANVHERIQEETRQTLDLGLGLDGGQAPAQEHTDTSEGLADEKMEEFAGRLMTEREAKDMQFEASENGMGV